jgi:hypothetical protein
MLFRVLCRSTRGYEVGRHGASDFELNPMVVESVWLAALLRTPDAASP